MARYPLHHQRLTRITTVVVAAAALSLAAPALASAAVYCVGSSGVICTVSKEGSPDGLQQALDDAAATPTPDLVRIAPGTYVGTFDYTSTSEVGIQGSGAATVLEGDGDAVALHLSGSGVDSVLSDLEIRTSNLENSDGLLVESAVAENVRVVNPSNSPGGSGVWIGSGGYVLGSTIAVGPKTGIGDQFGGGTHVVRDTLISGRRGVIADDPGATWTLDRVQIFAEHEGISGIGVDTTLRNSIVSVSGGGGLNQGLYHRDGTLTVDHVTLHGGELAGDGIFAAALAGTTTTIDVSNSIVSGGFADNTFARYAQAGGEANIVAGYSNFAPPDPNRVGANAGPGSFQEAPDGTNSNLDPRFVNALVPLDSPELDLRLRHDSPLVDKGQPGGNAGERDVDLQPRVANGDGAGDAVRDLGAYEYQRRPPSAAIASPNDGSVFGAGTPLVFSAQGSSDPDAGDELSYHWSFGDGVSGSGAEAGHAYETDGQRTVTLTVTDPTGLTATASSALLIVSLGPTGTDSGTPASPGANAADGVAPVLSAVSLTAPVFRVAPRAAAAGLAPRGTRVRFRLSEAAAVRFAIRRRARGRWVGFGAFTRQLAAGRGAVRFSGRVRVRGRTRALPAGRYTLTLVATDAAGNRSAAKRLPFRVTRR